MSAADPVLRPTVSARSASPRAPRTRRSRPASGPILSRCGRAPVSPTQSISPPVRSPAYPSASSPRLTVEFVALLQSSVCLPTSPLLSRRPRLRPRLRPRSSLPSSPTSPPSPAPPRPPHRRQCPVRARQLRSRRRSHRRSRRAPHRPSRRRRSRRSSTRSASTARQRTSMGHLRPPPPHPPPLRPSFTLSSRCMFSRHHPSPINNPVTPSSRSTVSRPACSFGRVLAPLKSFARIRTRKSFVAHLTVLSQSRLPFPLHPLLLPSTPPLARPPSAKPLASETAARPHHPLISTTQLYMHVFRPSSVSMRHAGDVLLGN